MAISGQGIRRSRQARGRLPCRSICYQLAYSPEAIKALVANPSDRKAAAEKLVEAIGGKLHDFFFAFGKYDVVCLIEAPDDAAMAAGALAVAAAGTASAARPPS